LLIDIEEIDTVFKNLFSNYTDKLILVGFDLYSEFNWMSQKFPSLSSYFAAWIDVQEIASERAGRSEDIRLSLSDTLRALNIKDWHKKRHTASHDAVRCLAALFGLAFSDIFTISARPIEVKFLSKLSSSYTHPFTARITTRNGSKLPSEFPTARSLSKYFIKYDLKAVALNRGGFLKSDGVRVWGLSFSTFESMTQFAADMDGSTLEGKELAVETTVMSLEPSKNRDPGE
jgi:hypothetical protein